jgi:hypothetical protein
MLVVAAFAVVNDRPWICIISFLVFLLLLGPSYHQVNSCARNNQETLFRFLEKDYFDLTSLGITSKAGPYGVYIEFSI